MEYWYIANCNQIYYWNWYFKNTNNNHIYINNYYIPTSTATICKFNLFNRYRIFYSVFSIGQLPPQLYQSSLSYLNGINETTIGSTTHLSQQNIFIPNGVFVNNSTNNNNININSPLNSFTGTDSLNILNINVVYPGGVVTLPNTLPIQIFLIYQF